MASPEPQTEGSFEVMADELGKTANAAGAAQVAGNQQVLNNIAAQLLQGGVSALNQLMHSNVRLLDMAAQKSMDHWDKVNVIADANAGAAADAAIDQSPPDEGTRQAG